MPLCVDCGTRIQSGRQCSMCELDERYGDAEYDAADPFERVEVVCECGFETEWQPQQGEDRHDHDRECDGHTRYQGGQDDGSMLRVDTGASVGVLGPEPEALGGGQT